MTRREGRMLEEALMSYSKEVFLIFASMGLEKPQQTWFESEPLIFQLSHTLYYLGHWTPPYFVVPSKFTQLKPWSSDIM